MPLYYTIEKKEDSQSAEWEPLTDHKIDPEEASYLSKSHNIFVSQPIYILLKLNHIISGCREWILHVHFYTACFEIN